MGGASASCLPARQRTVRRRRRRTKLIYWDKQRRFLYINLQMHSKWDVWEQKNTAAETALLFSVGRV